MNINKFKNKNIHILGISGNEGSSILNFLLKHNIGPITCHDFIEKVNLEKNFKTWHKGVNSLEKEKLWQTFSKNLSRCVLHVGGDYLQDIDKADVIFLPQSWRLYAKNNALQNIIKNKNILLYNLTKLYLDYAKAQIVGITGTVGKGSTANLLAQLLKKGLPRSRSVYFAGNETWMPQVTEQLDMMKKEDILILEISHRQLMDGINKSPHIAVFTNIYPNHLDELDYKQYQKIKLTLIKAQKKDDIAVLNYDNPELIKYAQYISSKVLYFSVKSINMNTKNTQNVYKSIMNINSIHYPENVLAAATVANILGVTVNNIKKNLSTLTPLPARIENIGSLDGVNFYDDIKSTTPWATIRALQKLGKNTILICGGDTKGINYDKFISEAKSNSKYIICLQSNLSSLLEKRLSEKFYQVSDTLVHAVNQAYRLGSEGDNILVSPAAAFFYSKFIARGISLKKIFTSLLPKAKV